jgi:hypothetical protein
VAYEKNRLMSACLKDEVQATISDFALGNGFVTKGIWTLSVQTYNRLALDELDSGKGSRDGRTSVSVPSNRSRRQDRSGEVTRRNLEWVLNGHPAAVPLF